MAKQVSQKEFQDKTSSYVNVSSERLGGQVVSFSDEWFAAASNLIKPNPPIVEVRFVPSGRWYDGWETRRHNPEPSDWVIIKLGVASANLIGCEVDTTFFSGNHAPAISVEGTYIPAEGDITAAQWEEVIPVLECGPTQQHFFLREKLTEKGYSHVRLHMYPDGGIARFRIYGKPIPVFPTDKNEVVDMASIANGGTCVACSDQHFSSADNLLLPGRGVDMSDGWETSRSRVKGHEDWAIIQLGAPAYIEHIVVDTAFFFGNYPQAIRVEAISSPGADVSAESLATAKWTTVVSDFKTSANKEHLFDKATLASVSSPVTHVKLSMIPDGGVKRLRVYGRRG